MLILLVIATAASITALFLRGFKLKDWAEQIQSKSIQTPSLEGWLLSIPDYQTKMDAYKAGIAAADDGFGNYILTQQGTWIWVAGVYTSEVAAKEALGYGELPETATVQLYSIKSKKQLIDPEAFEPCQQILQRVQNVFQLLLNLRTTVENKTSLANLKLELTTEYNQIKLETEKLQELNSVLKNEFIATMIYTANQNLLGLQTIITENHAVTTAMVNDALLKTFFSLDNF